MVHQPDGQDGATGSTPHWATEYNIQQKLTQQTRDWKSLLHPSVIAACLAVAGRVLLGPVALVLLFTATNYFSGGSVLIKATDSFFAFTEQDLTMSGGCSGCIGSCKITLLKFALFNGSAFVSSPVFNAFVAQGPVESLYDFSSLNPEVIALGESLDTNGVVCQSGTNDWGATHNVATGTAQQILDIIYTLSLSVAPQMMEHTHGPRLFQFPSIVGDANFGKMSAVDINIFPDYTECRPAVTIDDDLVGSKVALLTHGEDFLRAVPDSLTVFPYSFSSSLPRVSREAPAGTTKYPATTVTQPLLRGYFGGCRVREVNSTGIFIEHTCEMSTHWESYGLMVHSPDDIPLCSTGDVCIHNYFNSLWEWLNYVSKDQPGRAGMVVNSFRTRYADTVDINILPALVVAQILLMGIVCFYQVMPHKRSVLLTQIWAYRCQNGHMQVVYLAQIIYHLVFYSDLYMIGLATGTLTGESIANLTCCTFAFSYSFINLLKARSGSQQLDRHFRLTWETMQLVTTICVGSILLSVKRTPFESIITKNAEILRKTSSRGAKFCGLNDSCILFTVDMASVIAIMAVGLGTVALAISFTVAKVTPKAKSVVRSLVLTELHNLKDSGSFQKVTKKEIDGIASEKKLATQQVDLTTFERHCIGIPFKRLFRDCDDIAISLLRGTRLPGILSDAVTARTSCTKKDPSNLQHIATAMALGRERRHASGGTFMHMPNYVQSERKEQRLVFIQYSNEYEPKHSAGFWLFNGSAIGYVRFTLLALIRPSS
ncbi:hypothetical protein ON010_g14266 [Phytophthora cinnamomi]|nr:hypothetical protein ON010_g14266 [Phytophthora cinnamomi]